MRKAFVVLKDFSDTSPMPGAHIARPQCITCSGVTPTLEPMFEALLARPEEVRVLLLHDGLAHDPDELAAWAREAQCIPDFFLGPLPGKQPPGGGCHERAAIIPTDRLYAISPNFTGKGWI